MLLPLLKKEGFNYAAFECDWKDQEHIDEFLAEGVQSDKMKEILRKQKLQDNVHYLHQFRDSRADDWINSMQLAHNLGMEIIFYDDRQALPKEYIGMFAGEMVGNTREGNCFGNIKRILDKNPDAKVIVYGGAGHMSEQLKKGCVYLLMGLDGIQTVIMNHGNIKEIDFDPLGRRLHGLTGGKAGSIDIGQPDRKQGYFKRYSSCIDLNVSWKSRADYLAHKIQHRQKRGQNK
jgi:hypothetical protein